MINKKKLLVLVVSIVFLISTYVLGVSGILDEFQGWDFSNAGSPAVDTFVLEDSDAYVIMNIDGSQRWDGGANAGMYVAIQKKGFLGIWSTKDYKTFTKTQYDTSSVSLSYTNLDTGTYRMYFASTYADKVDFSGTVYDD